MSILDAVIILASVIKQIAEDAGANSTMSASLAARVEIIPRILKKIPETSEVDVDLLHRMYGFLKESHDVILEYKSKGMMSRMITAGSMRARFAAVEANIGRCIDDLSFNVGVTSAAVLESIRNDIRRDNEQREGSALDGAPVEETDVVEEEDECMDFAGFDEITSHIENLSSALKVFGSQEITEHDITSGGKQPASSVVFYGDKMIVQNLRKPKGDDRKSRRDEEYSEEGIADSMSMQIGTLSPSSQNTAGVIVFHIDNTSSMLREKRMVLVKDVLKRVIPNFLRMGFRVIVNAWASTPENKGAIKSREVVLDESLLQVLHGGVATAAQASSEGDSGNSLSGDALIHQYLEKHIFDILQPKGRTDLYGSCFQLIRQCSTLLGPAQGSTADVPVHAFVLTDGEHNLLNAPLHRPARLDEDYFGVFTAIPTKHHALFKFGITHKEPSVPVCERFLRAELDRVNGRNTIEGSDMGVSDPKKTRLTVTFVGIGDAETKPLSDLTNAMGADQCSFYGITEVSQCDEVFRNISAGSSEICVTCDLSSSTGADGTKKVNIALKCTFEDESSGWLMTHGSAARLEDHFAVQGLHASLSLNVTQPSAVGSGVSTLSLSAAASHLPGDTASVSPYDGHKITTAELHRRVNEFVSEIRRVRDSAYVVDATSFGTVFRQLMADKKALQSIKNTFLSKHTRRLRQYSLFSGLGVWLRELEELIESQIASYRMNVEGEILTKIAQGEVSVDATSGKNSAKGGAGAGGNYLQPTQMVLFRLQNNLSNAGKSSHRVVRHVAAISSIRDRTMHIACTLFTTSLSLHYLYEVSDDTEASTEVSGRAPIGVRLTVQRAEVTAATAGVNTAANSGQGKIFNVDWTIPSGSSPSVEVEQRVQQIYDFCLDVADSCAEIPAPSDSASEDAYDRYSHLLAGLSSSISKRALPRNVNNAVSRPIDATVVFPCILLAAKFDAFTIVRSTYVFFTCEVLCCEGADGELQAKVFCAQEIWELCHASNHIVGEALPIGSANTSDIAATVKANMILPLAHTPLLFALYVERGRAYHSAVNVTADCMALTVVSLQWAKFFHDGLLLTLHVGRRPSAAHLQVFVQESLKAVVSLAYCIDSFVMLPSIAGLNKMFAFDAERSEAVVVSENVVISREDCAGLTCSIAVASMVAGGHLSFAHSPHSWNILLRTLFSRLAEAISGQKIVRVAAAPVANDAGAAGDSESAEQKDPGALENDYRLKLGELQGLLRKRLHVEWVKSSFDEKRAQVELCAADILACLQFIVQSFLNRLDGFGLQSWSQTAGLVVQALLLHSYGIERLQRDFVELVSLSALEKQIIESGDAYLSSAFLFPVCERNAQGILVLREATEHDVDHLIMYIDALVATKAGPKLEYKPILNPTFPVFSAADTRDASYQQATVAWDNSLPCANIAFIGNVNSGKSSISGILLEYLRIVPPDVVDRLGKIATKLGLSESLKHAWVMDTTPQERSGGFTVQSSWAGFQTPSRRYTIIDNPGHKDFGRNAAFGVFEADFVVLVMPANLLLEVENGTAAQSLSQQAEEHLMTAFCFGVRELVVAVNKMDLVDYSQEAFEAVRAYTLKIMKKAGFKAESATFVPVSVAHGEGFLSVSDRVAGWYTGPCLLQACDELPLPRRVVDKPLRMVIDGVHRDAHKSSNQLPSNKGVTATVVVTGRIERGVLAVNDEVNLTPAGPQRARVTSMMLHGTTIEQGRPGDIVGLSLQLQDNHGRKLTQSANMKVGAPERPVKGMIISSFGQPTPPVLERFEVQLLVVKGTMFKVGFKPALTTHTAVVAVEIVKLIEIIGRNNTVTETNPSEVKAGQTVVCEMKSLRPFAAETIHDMPRLSRFLIKQDRAIAAIGFIRRIIS